MAADAGVNLKSLQGSGPGGRIGLDPQPVMRRLRIGTTQFAEDSAYLAAHGLVGVRDFRPDANGVPSATCSAIWITGKGEDYLKRSQPGPRPAAPPGR